MAHSEETKAKISQSLKYFHQAVKNPPKETTKTDLLRDGFLIGSGVSVVVRDYSKIGVKENDAQTRNETKNNALKEKDDGIPTTES
jgi:hypothetical protein